MSNIIFRTAAKTDIGLVRTNNEDNFQVAADLSTGKMGWVSNELYSLGDLGALLVVADGMGGMNAGEVASELAIETVKECFTPERITPAVIQNRFSIEKFMNEVIVAADSNIKLEAARNPESRGMGTTIVIGWILGNKLYVSWCGDSRAYIYNSAAGLHQITKDHSYVQDLVDRGSLTREEAFDFPDSNIVTRSLSDAHVKAKPQSLLRPFELCDGDIILLCTDGLSGMLRDAEMEAVIRRQEHDMDLLASELIGAACDAEGSDNITVCLLRVERGGGVCNPAVFKDTEKWLNGRSGNGFVTTLKNGKPGIDGDKNQWSLKKIMSVVAVAVLVLALAVAITWRLTKNSYEKRQRVEAEDILPEQEEEATPPVITETSIEPDTDSDGGSGGTSSGNGVDTTSKGRGSGGIEDIFERYDSNRTDKEGTGGGDTSKLKDLTPVVNPPDDEVIEDQIEDTTGGENESEVKLHVVKKGESLYRIAKDYGITEDDIKKANGLEDDHVIRIGDTLKIPVKK